MALTVTAAISSQSVGTSTNVGTAKFPQKVTLQAGTARIAVVGQLTLGTTGAAVPDTGCRPRIWYANSPTSYADAATGAAACHATARYIDLVPGNVAGAVTEKGDGSQWVTGGYLYIWVDQPKFPVAGSLTVNVVELPLAPV